jgi:hypothetical protein
MVEQVEPRGNMSIRLDNNLAQRIYCLARQAERSVDFALASARQWELFRQYYDDSRRGRILDLVRVLEPLVANRQGLISRDQIPGITASWVLFYPIRWLLNHFQSKCTFSETELIYIVIVFRAFVQATDTTPQPDPTSLVQLRMDLQVVEEIIQMKLTGITSLRKAKNVEHFSQADHVISFSVDELCL